MTLGASTGLLFIGIRGLQPKSKKTIAFLWRQGFGAVDSGAAFTTGPSSSSAADILSNILLANLPQLILSFLYLMYNGLYTCMLLTDEWSGFALQAKPLRVTSFKGHQRTTRWLQLPYSYAIPLSVASGAMHWFISQSIFLARITIYDENGNEDTGHSLSSCGYSPIAIIFTLILGTLMVLVVLINGFRRYHPGIPLASSCSAAISAACHPPPEDVDAAFLPVKWGAIPTKDGDVGHCTFTSQTVVPPVEGELYAGMEKGDTRSSLELTNDAVSWRPGLWKRRKVWSE